MSYRNVHKYFLKDYKSGQVFEVGEEFDGKGVPPKTLKSWLSRELIEKVTK